MKQMPVLLCAVLVASLLAACGTVRSSASGLVGTYTTTLTKADLDPSYTGSPGTWILKLDAVGQFTASKNDQIENSGTYTVVNNQFTITDPRCGPFTGKYTWMLEKMMLTLKAGQDQDICINRRLVLTARPWVKQGVPLAVQSITVSVNPPDLHNINCGYPAKFTYTAQVSVNQDNNGGAVHLLFNPVGYNAGIQNQTLIFAPGETTQTATFTLTGTVSENQPFWPTVTVSSTSPNQVESSRTSPTGLCSNAIPK
jgi:hypothetical protein